ncbi:MAG TPA: hypothetical protein ENJ53_01295 [Phaeodactylibacter sp.]|nr:hypothetical protein [Phaeodactylibacter sp.]
MSVEALKLEILNKIMALHNAYDLKKIEATLEAIETDRDILKRLSTPIKKDINIEELKKEQNWKPVNKKNLFQLMDEMDIEEPLEDLLKMI